MGDEIIYKYNGETRKYTIDTIEVIADTDWSYLEQTKDNRITLITCVEDQPKLRRAIQGVLSSN
ncbi:MAG: sortase [Firmicutes bacterium]|nr:sortase [Bacillota bacterium]